MGFVTSSTTNSSHNGFTGFEVSRSSLARTEFIDFMVQDERRAVVKFLRSLA